ncbi:MAG: (Fe-S)-binding protein [Methylovulum sp.]|nr:(Fe-S)-binding protein [Methylovulum sp.]
MDKLLANADACVKCGLCLPHCPTYTHSHDENESPRGRIALIQAWANQQLATSEKLVEHIDNCLLCRSCERVCPAVVPYGRLIDNFRSHLYVESDASFALSLMKKVASNKPWQNITHAGLKLYQTTPLQKIARLLSLPKLFRLEKIDRLLPDYVAPVSLESSYYATTAHVKGNVGLFVGCMGTLLDQETIRAAISVLTTVGFNVYLPEQQTCCGALALHDGDGANAAQLAEVNHRAFKELPLDVILTIASGCGSQLQDHMPAEFSGKVADISQFLAQSTNQLGELLKPLPATVCLHTPCSLKNAMRAEQGALKLLQHIPDINIASLPNTLLCCGSAGSYMLEHAKMAQLLLNDLLDAALASDQPDYLVSSNIGCALHIAAGLKERGITLEVLHPITLIARQLK